jgi:hypothetical protein
MKKNVLALSIAAMIGGLGFVGTASADLLEGSGTALASNAEKDVNKDGLLIDLGTPGNSLMSPTTATTLTLSEGGVGHMLLVPYYSAQNGNMTVLHLVNTDTVNGKAVKVRFRGAANSDDVMDFQVYMSPGDVWTGAVTAGADGIAQIQSADNTCSVPALGINAPKAFSTGRLNSKKSAAELANGTREGYVEIFNMADIPSDKIYGTTATKTQSALYTAIKHVNGVAPCSVAGSASETTLFNVALTNFTAEEDAANAGFNTPTGGLMGDWYIINVPETTTFSGANTAVVANGRGNFVHFPQVDTGVASTVIDTFTADPLLRTVAYRTDSKLNSTAGTPALAAGNYDLPDMSTPYLLRGVASYGATPADISDANFYPLAQADKLTTALAVSTVTNQYANDESISAKTDWVFSMPTRRYSVVANYAAITSSAGAVDTNTAYRLFSNLKGAHTLNVAGDALDAAVELTDAVSAEWFTPANTLLATDESGNICVKADGQRFWDREETTPGASTAAPVFSPRTPGVAATVALCGETSVLAFKSTGNSVLASSVARTTITSGTYTNGWGVVTTTNNNFGLPVLGASFIKLSNPQVAAGLSGTYGITWPHRFTKVTP